MKTSSLRKIPDTVLRHVTGSFLTDKDVIASAASCRALNTLFKKDLDHHALRKLFLAVIDDKRELIKKILENKSELLLRKKPEKIRSQLTWQEFLVTDNAFQLAQKLKRIEVLKIMLPYVKHLDSKDEKLWVLPAPLTDDEQKKRDEILRHEYFKKHLEPLANIIAKDECKNKIVNVETEQALENFRKTLLPTEPIEIDNYFDIEQMLIAALQTYDVFHNAFLTWDRREIFAINVVGFIQSVISPEIAKAYCEGLFFVINYDKPISPRADKLKLQDNHTFFYRVSQDSRNGLGFDFLCGIWASVGGVAMVIAPSWAGGDGRTPYRRLEKYFNQRRQNLAKLQDEKHLLDSTSLDYAFRHVAL